MAASDEHRRREQAITWYEHGISFSEIIRRLGRSREWLAKWLRRYRECGWDGLRDRSRAPHTRLRRLPEGVEQDILHWRQRLEQRIHRAWRFAGVGAEVIREALHRHNVVPLPSISTIERVLRRHGYPRRTSRQPSRPTEPYPAPRATRPGDLHQNDLVGPRYLRGPRGVVRFYALATVAVVGGGAALSVVRHKTALALCQHCVRAWRGLGIPRISQFDNEMAATGGHRHPYGLSLLMRLHLLLGSHLVFIPPREPGRNAHVESFNALWQARVLREPCPDLPTLRTVTERFLRYYHTDKPHRRLRIESDGTRFPGAWLEAHRGTLRAVPLDFRLATYIDHRGRLRLPLARGRLSFIRRVATTGEVEVLGCPYFIGKRLAGRYVVATIVTHRRTLAVTLEHRTIRRYPFLIREPVVAPLVPLPAR